MSEVYNLAHSTRVEHEFARDLERVRASVSFVRSAGSAGKDCRKTWSMKVELPA